MANDNFPRGLWPLELSRGGTVRTSYYRVDTATDLFLGMPVVRASDGEVAPAVIGSNNQILGSIVGFDIAGGILELDPFLDVSDLGDVTVRVAVADDPDQRFLIQEDTGGSALTLAALGTSVTPLYRATSGNTTTGYANLEVDRSTIVADTSGQLVLMETLDQINQDGTQNDFGNYCKLIVRILHHQNRGGAWNTPI